MANQITRRSLLLSTPALLCSPRISSAWLIQSACGSSHTGVGDIVSLDGYWSVRAYSRAYAQSLGNVFDLRRSSDNATMTATLLCTGDLNSAAISAWAGADNIFVSKAYDQSGNGRHVTQGANASQPQLLLTGGVASKPCLSVAANNAGLTGANTTPATGVVSMFALANRSTSGAVVTMIAVNKANRTGIFGTDTFDYGSGANRSKLRSQTGTKIVATGVTDGSWWRAVGVVNGASSVISINGTDTTGSLTGDTTGGNKVVMNGVNGTTLKLSECGYKDDSAWDSTTRSAVDGNISAYYV